MSLNKRIIPILQLRKRELIKTINFSPKRYLGDPLNAVRIFNLKGVNELIIIDIGATQTKVIDFPYLEKLSAQAFVPLVYGGGISSIEDVHRLYQLGFDRLIFGTCAMETPQLVEQVASMYGNQSVICSLDIYKNFFGNNLLTCRGGLKNKPPHDIENMIIRFIEMGAGEILLHDKNRDGTYLGLNHSLIQKVSDLSSVPIIACGGTNSIEDAKKALDNGASAVAAGSIFSFYGRHRAILMNYCMD